MMFPRFEGDRPENLTKDFDQVSIKNRICLGKDMGIDWMDPIVGSIESPS